MYIVLCNSMVDRDGETPTKFYKGEGLLMYDTTITAFPTRYAAEKAIKETERRRGDELWSKYEFQTDYKIVKVVMMKADK